VRIGAFLGSASVARSSLSAFKFSSKQIMERLDTASGAKTKKSLTANVTVQHSKTLVHTIDPMQLIKEIKRSAREQIRELFIVQDVEQTEGTLSEHPEQSAEGANQQQDTNPAPPQTTQPPPISQKLVRELKKLPVLTKLSHLRVECIPENSVSVQILHQIMRTSPLKRVEIVPDVLDVELTKGMALKNSVKRLEILPSPKRLAAQTEEESDEPPSESQQQRYEQALIALFAPSSEDQVSSLQQVFLRNASLNVIQNMIHLRITLLHVEIDAEFSSAGGDQETDANDGDEEQIVPRLSSLRECCLRANDSSYVRHVLFTICPSNLERLQLETHSTDSATQLISFDEEAVQHLANVKQIRLTNVASTSVQHLLKAAGQSAKRLQIASSVPDTIVDNALVCSLSKCSQLSSISLSSVKLTNQFFAIIGEYKSPALRGLTMRDVRWHADPITDWEHANVTNNEEDAEAGTVSSSCGLQAAWIENVTFKTQSDEENVPQKGKKVPAKGKGKSAQVAETSEDGSSPDDADFASLCTAAPLLECLVLRRTNVGDAHVEALAVSPMSASLQNLEISNSSQPIHMPSLTSEHPFSSLRRFYIYSEERADYVSLKTLITLALLSPRVETIQIVPQFPTHCPTVQSSQVFEEMDQYARQTDGSMWGTFLKESVFRREVVPRIISQLDTIYSIERDRSIVRGGLNRLLSRTGGMGGSEKWDKDDELNAGRVLKTLFDAVFGTTGTTFD